MKTLLILSLALLFTGCHKVILPPNNLPSPINYHVLDIIYKPQYVHSNFTVGLDYPNGNVEWINQTNTRNTIHKKYTLLGQPVLVSANSYQLNIGTDTLIITLDGVVIVNFIGQQYSDVIQVN